jgi:uncharacterized delta-60 repeat protein
MSQIKNTLRILFVLCLFTSNVFAQDGSNDSTFNTFDDGTFGTGTSFNSTAFASCIQTDGKIVVGGTFNDYNGTQRTRIARLNTDGSLDTTFNPGSGFDNPVNFIKVQTDGKIIVGGQFTSFNGTLRNRIVRLNTDGSLDTTFNIGLGFDSWVQTIDIQTDGKIIVGGYFTSFNGIPTNRIVRLNADGSFDTTFNSGAGFNGGINTIDIQTDGKIIAAGGFFSYNGAAIKSIARLNTDGSLDLTFNPGTGFDNAVEYISIQSDGKIVVGGQFTIFNGTTANRIIRLNTNGSADATFNPGLGFDHLVNFLGIQTDGKIVAGGIFTSFNGTTRNRIARLNTDGSLDTTFNPGTGFNSMVYAVNIQSDGKIIAAGQFTNFNGNLSRYIARLHSDGTLDPFFNQGSGFQESVIATSIQTDGKIIVGGHFVSFNGTSRRRIARLFTDGSLDTTFNPGGFNAPVRATNIQTDGKIITGGQFTNFDGTTRNRIARLNTDGSLDTSFDPGIGFNNMVFSTSIQTDGKVIVGGAFTNFNGTSRNRIARLNTDGSLDTTFNPGTGFNNNVQSISVQTDGKIIVGGDFFVFNGTARFKIARLNADGSLDTTFDPGSGFGGQVTSTSLQTDGKIVVAGGFASFNGTPRNRIARLNSDGSLDLTFDPGIGPNGGISTMSIQADGKFVVGGGFTTFNGNPLNRIARLTIDGSLDSSFDPGIGFEPGNTSFGNQVRTTSIQADGKIIAGGDFSEFDGNPRNRIARLLNCIPPTLDSLGNVSICDGYALPALTVGNYYTAPSGGGTMLNAGDTITSTQTLYVYATNGTCADENSFDVSILPSPVEPANMTPTTVCPGSDVILSATGSGSGDMLFFDATPTLIGTIAMPPGTATYNVGPLTAGSYTFGVAESNGICQSVPAEIIVNVV